MTDLTSRDTESTSVSTAVGSNITADVANMQRNMLVFFALIMVLIGISFYLKPRDGTVVTEVATHAVRVEFRKGATTWELRPSVLCLYEKRRGARSKRYRVYRESEQQRGWQQGGSPEGSHSKAALRRWRS